MRARCGFAWLVVVSLVAGCAGDKSEGAGETDPDADGDGYPASEDCDDTDPSVYPGAVEACDGKDNDCDGVTDLDDADVVGVETGPIDSDGDGFGDPQRVGNFCPGNRPANIADNALDCDDRDDAVNPDGNEVCDDIDNDCDGFVDGDDADATAIPTWSLDGDGDGWGDAVGAFRSCENPGDGYAENGLDCDDSNGEIHPEATESCGDGVDSDCDGADGYEDFRGDGELECAYIIHEGATGALASGDLDGDGETELVFAGLDGVSIAPDPLTDGAATALMTLGAVPVLAIGDLGGDGAADLGVATWSGGEARLLLQEGPISAGLSADDDILLGTSGAPAALLIGDLDGDGGGEALVGLPGASAGTSMLLRIELGGSPQEVLADEALAGLGASLAWVGDVDGDGLDDVAVGAAASDQVLIVGDFDGGDFGLVDSIDGSGGFGHAVAGAGDVDGDGLDDVLVGAPTYGGGAGAVFVIVADHEVRARMDGPAGGASGTSLGVIGDLNQDGNTDVVVGSPGVGEGRADVIIGPLPTGDEGTLDLVAYQLVTDQSGAEAGAAVSGGLDLNSDGYHDLVVALPGVDQTAVFLGVRNW